MALSLKEARDLISDSEFVSELNDLKCKISYPHLDLEIEIGGLYNIYEYFYNQFVGWEKIKHKVPEILMQESILYYKKKVEFIEKHINLALIRSVLKLTKTQTFHCTQNT